MSRGGHNHRKCGGGCDAAEILNHVIQRCHRTHLKRADRQEAVSKYFINKLRNQGYEVIAEARITTEEGHRKRDTIATENDVAFVIDAQILGE